MPSDEIKNLYKDVGIAAGLSIFITFIIIITVISIHENALHTEDPSIQSSLNNTKTIKGCTQIEDKRKGYISFECLIEEPLHKLPH